MMIMEHILMGFKVVMMYVIDDVPRWIREAIARKNAMEREASVKARLHQYVAGDNQPGTTTAASPRSEPQHSRPASLSIAPPRKLSHQESSAWFPQQLPPSKSPKEALDDGSISTLGATETASHSGHGHGHGHNRSKRATSIMSMFSLKSHTSPKQSHHHRTASAPPAPEAAFLATLNDRNSEEQPAAARPLPPSARSDSATSNLTPTSSMYDLNRVDFAEPHDLDKPENTTEKAASTPLERLMKQTESPFGFDPAHMMILICLPAALHYFQITPWLYIPIAVLFFGYLQSKKDRIDRKIAMGIVSDPTLLRLILEEMPNWPTDSEFQQMVRFPSLQCETHLFLNTSFLFSVYPIVYRVCRSGATT